MAVHCTSAHAFQEARESGIVVLASDLGKLPRKSATADGLIWLLESGVTVRLWDPQIPFPGRTLYCVPVKWRVSS